MRWGGNLLQQVMLELGRLRRAVDLTEVRGVESVSLVAVVGRRLWRRVSSIIFPYWRPCCAHGNVFTIAASDLHWRTKQNRTRKSKAKERSHVISESCSPTSFDGGALLAADTKQVFTGGQLTLRLGAPLCPFGSTITEDDAHDEQGEKDDS